jgi:hypothetical protein
VHRCPCIFRAVKSSQLQWDREGRKCVRNFDKGTRREDNMKVDLREGRCVVRGRRKWVQ